MAAMTLSLTGMGCAQAQKQTTDKASELPKVYFIKEINSENLVKVYEALGRKAEGKVAVKLSTGEPGGHNFLQPALIAPLVKKVNGTIVECNTAYGGGRANTEAHLKAAADHGFTAIAEVDIMDANGEVSLPVKDGKWFTEMHVGSHQLNYDSMLVLTHFKGHTMGGFGGSNKNIGIGCADGRIGKAEIHTAVGSDNMWSISEEELMERISESAKATVDYFKDHISFINVMRNMSVSCDCEGVSAAPVVTPNVGILASLDICAIDQASVDLIYAMKEEDHHDLVERIKTRHGLRQLSYMQELDMGNRKYKLIDLDNNQSPLTLQEAVAHVVPFFEPKKVTL